MINFFILLIIQNKIINNQAYYFARFKNLRTYTIIAGKIQKGKCVEEGKNYSFNILQTISSSIIPEEKDIEINVKKHLIMIVNIKKQFVKLSNRINME